MRVHFIAIGGSVMHDLAIALTQKGFIVTGSDDLIYEPSKSQLLKHKLLPAVLGWFPEKIDDQLDAVILGMHSEEDNPELLKAKELGLSVFSYPEFIYEQSIEKNRVVIAGSYGKTTITAMIMHVLKKLGREFDYVVGAQFEGFEHRVSITKEAPLIIIEGDEYLASSEDKRPKMLIYKANIGLISNIYWDHKNVFPTREDYAKQFEFFIESIQKKGTLVYNKEDKDVQAMVSTNNSNINKHGYRVPEYTINKGITFINTPQEDIPLEVFGKYNLSNIAGAYSVCEWLGINREKFHDAIRDFRGTSRRLEHVRSNEESVVYQDFAPIPSKIKPAIQALKEQYPDQELITVLELPIHHTFDEEFFNDYKGAFELSDFPVIFINESLLKQKTNFEINEYSIRKALDNHKVSYINSKETLENYLKNVESNGKNLLFISAGTSGSINIVNSSKLFIS